MPLDLISDHFSCDAPSVAVLVTRMKRWIICLEDDDASDLSACMDVQCRSSMINNRLSLGDESDIRASLRFVWISIAIPHRLITWSDF